MRTLLDSFYSAAKKHPEKVALKSKDERLSYKTLYDNILSVSNWMSNQGLSSGDRVGIHLPNSFDYVIIYYACWAASLVPVPLNTFSRSRHPVMVS